ncbi:lipoprotein [Arthrobacter tecti]
MLRRVVVVLCLLLMSACTRAPAEAPSESPESDEPSISVEVSRPPLTEPPVSVSTPDVAKPPAAEPDLVLATDASGDSLLVVDPADRENPVQDTIPVGAAPWDVYVAAGQAFVSTAEGVAVVDLDRRARTALIPYAHQPAPVEFGEYRPGGTGIVASDDGSTVYVAVVVAGGTSVLEKIDVAAGQSIGSVEVGLRPFDILLSDDGSEVYTIDHDSFSVHIVDAGTLAARQIEVAPFGTEDGLASWEKLHYGAIDDDGNLLLPYQGLALAVVDPATGTVAVEEMTANSHQHGAAYIEGKLLGIGTGAFGNATGEPNLTIRDLATDQEEIVPLGRLHETVLPWTDAAGTQYALLSGGYTREGFWPGITAVNLETLEQYELDIPGRPQSLAAIP